MAAVACFLPGRARDLSAPPRIILLLIIIITQYRWIGAERFPQKFPLNESVRQASSLSLTLVSIYVDDMIRILKTMIQPGIRKSNTFIGIFLWADNLIILLKNLNMTSKHQYINFDKLLKITIFRSLLKMRGLWRSHESSLSEEKLQYIINRVNTYHISLT